MDLMVTIPADDVDGLEVFVRKRLAVQYPGWDTTAVDVIQVMVDDYAEDQRLECAIECQRWISGDPVSTAEEVTSAGAAESAARDTKLATEAARRASRV